MQKKSLLYITLLLLSATSVAATSHLPPGLLQSIEANEALAQEFVTNVSFAVAFLAGMITLLSPCILPLIPAYFAVTFKEKRAITKMTSIFFSGFAVMFIVLGIASVLVGSASIIILQQNLSLFVLIGGILLIIFGLMSLFGKGFSGLVLERKSKNDTWGILGYGMVFALGWTVCVGPILGGILIMASVLHNYLTAVWLMFFYALGMFVPMFFFSIAYDRFNLANHPIIRGKTFTVSLGNVKQDFHSSNILSGTLLMATGIFFIVFRGTGEVNALILFGLKEKFYVLQNLLLENASRYNIIAIVILILFIGVTGAFMWKQIREDKNEIHRKE